MLLLVKSHSLIVSCMHLVAERGWRKTHHYADCSHFKCMTRNLKCILIVVYKSATFSMTTLGLLLSNFRCVFPLGSYSSEQKCISKKSPPLSCLQSHMSLPTHTPPSLLLQGTTLLLAPLSKANPPHYVLMSPNLCLNTSTHEEFTSILGKFKSFFQIALSFDSQF